MSELTKSTGSRGRKKRGADKVSGKWSLERYILQLYRELRSTQWVVGNGPYFRRLRNPAYSPRPLLFYASERQRGLLAGGALKKIERGDSRSGG